MKLESHYKLSHRENCQEKLLRYQEELAIVYLAIQKLLRRGYIPEGALVDAVMSAAKEVKRGTTCRTESHKKTKSSLSYRQKHMGC